MSLQGRRVLITRPEPQAAELAGQLIAAGGVPLRFPLIGIEPNPEARARLITQAAQADWLIFVSPGAIESAAHILGELGPKVRLACLGASSAHKLEGLAQRPVCFPLSGNDSASLLAMPAMQQVSGQRILLIRGEGGRAELSETLQSRGAQIALAEVYRRIEIAPDWSLVDPLLQQQQLDACIVTSSEIAERLFRLAGSARIPALQCVQYCVPHPRIAETLAAMGVVRIVTTRADNSAMIAGLREWFSRHP
jgi:uroporphyrinogen-III synthase